MKSSALFHLWKRQVFLRNRHKEFDHLLAIRGRTSGIYLIASAGEIVYIGQSWDLSRRSIESLGIQYHRVPDTSLPWSIAFAPCPPAEMDERESTAIRTFAPQFNTSLPSIAKSRSRMPNIVGVAAVFQDQDRPCGAFKQENLERQKRRAETNQNPPWAKKKKRRKTVKREIRSFETPSEPFKWTEDEAEELFKHYGVSLNEPLRFKINLCDEGSVVTKDGEYLGKWEMDENEHPSFYPDGALEPLFFDSFVGLLCQRITEWHETNTGEEIGP